MVEFWVVGAVAVWIPLGKSIEGTADEEPMEEEMLVAVVVGERSGEELEGKMPLA